jgi:hypothetical protein
MLMRVRRLAVVLLVLVLPWQAPAAMPTALHHHDATPDDAGAASVHRVHANAGHQHHNHAGAAAVQDHESGSTDTTHGICTNACYSPVLAVDAALALAAADDHGLMIPFAMHRLPSRAPDSLERPPRNSLV